MQKAQSSKPLLADANESMERNLTNNERTIFTTYGLIGAILLFGAAGYLCDRWLGTSPWLLVSGLLIGMAVGFFRLVQLVRH